MIALESMNNVKIVKCVTVTHRIRKKLSITIPVVDIQNLIFTLYSFFFGVCPTLASISNFYIFICLELGPISIFPSP